METPGVNKSSISAQYHTRTNGTPKLRNMAVINATKQSKNDPDTITKREELLKMIADTKKKLANVGHNSPLKYSKSIHDLSHIPEKDKWGSPGRKQGTNSPTTSQTTNRLTDFPYEINDNDDTHRCHVITNSQSVPVDLQLCDCHMFNTPNQNSNLYSNASNSNLYSNAGNNNARLNVNEPLKLSDVLSKSPEKRAKDLAAMIQPRKLQLDKTLVKYKMHKSLPVSPVNEECSFSDFVEESKTRKSFSYFVDFKDEIDKGFKEICADIEKFSRDFHYNDDLDDGNFSSDSLEEKEETSSVKVKSKKVRTLAPPRRCVSNNEIYKYQAETNTYSEFYHAYDCEIPKSESFYLNPSNKNSQDSILSEESKSFCNSLESILSNESDCRSAPLEALFTSHRRFKRSETGEFSRSLPKNHELFAKPADLKRSHTFTAETSLRTPEMHLRTSEVCLRASELVRSSPIGLRSSPTCLKTSQTQTDDFQVKSSRKISSDFQKKLEKFETQAENDNLRKGVAFFVDAKENRGGKRCSSMTMSIPSLESKNKQYKSKFCNVLNNKPELNIEIFESGNKNSAETGGIKNVTRNRNITLTNLNFGRNRNHIQETSSLDRHLLSKGLLDAEKVTHKPPKAVRRHSSKNRKKTYEYIKKDDFFKKYNNQKRNNNCSNENLAPSPEKTIDFCYKEQNCEKECENANFLHELYDSLDKPMSSCATKFELDSLEVNLNHNNDCPSLQLFDSLEIEKFTMSTHDFNLWRNSDVDKLKSETPKKKLNVNQNSIDRIQAALNNIKILNEIQKTVEKINNLVEVFKQNVSKGKVRALSKMYESYSVYNDLSRYQEQPKIKFRRRNLSLPNFVERRLNYEKATPNYEKTTPNYEKTTPNYEKTTPNYEKTSPAIEKSTLNSQKNLNSEKITPNSEKTTPNYEKTTLDYEKTTPDYEKTTPDYEKCEKLSNSGQRRGRDALRMIERDKRNVESEISKGDYPKLDTQSMDVLNLWMF